MGNHGYSLNSTNVMNDTYNFDPFCTDMLVGPLVWAIFSVPTACVGVPASAWLLSVLIQRQRSGSSNVYMLNLTIMDLVFNLHLIPNVLNNFVWHDLIFIWIGLICYGFNMCGRPLFMSCICVDCYMAVVHPITYMNMKHGRYRMVACISVWVSTLAYGYINSRSFGQSFITPVTLGVSAPVIAFCNLSTLCTLRKPDPSGRSDVHPQKQRAMQTIVNSLVMATASYLPPLIGLIGMYNRTDKEFRCKVVFPSYILATLGSTIMPILHLKNLGSLKNIRLMCDRN